MAAPVENIRSPRPMRAGSASGSSAPFLSSPASDSLPVTMSLSSNHWNCFNLSDLLPSATENSATFDDSDDELNISGDAATLSLRDLNKAGESYHQENTGDVTNVRTQLTACEHELRQLARYEEDAGDQQIPNASLIKQIEESNDKITRLEAQTKKLEDEKKKEHREHKNQMSKMKKKVKTLSENLRSKEESVIPGFMKQIEEKELSLDECRTNLTTAQQEANLLKETLSKCNEDLSRTSEERDIVTTELKGHMCDTGRITNEMSEVLSVRENMAKQYYQEKCKLLNHIEILQIESRRKQHLIDRLITRVDFFEAQSPELAAIAIQDPHDPFNLRNRGRTRVTRWCYNRFGVLWPAQVVILVALTIFISLLLVFML